MKDKEAREKLARLEKTTARLAEHTFTGWRNMLIRFEALEKHLGVRLESGVRYVKTK